MARIERDSFHGGYRVTGLEHDINKARQNRQFQQDMSRIGDQLTSAPADAFAGAVRTTAGITAGGVALGVGMARNRRFRYIMQAILHFPMAFVVVMMLAVGYVVPRTTISEGSDGFRVLGQVALVGLIGAVIWTAAYIFFRTRPKLKRLRGY